MCSKILWKEQRYFEKLGLTIWSNVKLNFKNWIFIRLSKANNIKNIRIC